MLPIGPMDKTSTPESDKVAIHIPSKEEDILERIAKGEALPGDLLRGRGAPTEARQKQLLEGLVADSHGGSLRWRTVNNVLIAAYELVDADMRGDPIGPAVALLRARLQAYSGEG